MPAHPVAGTEHSGPDSGFAELFINRWCILTPPEGTDPAAVEKLRAFWAGLGARVEIMTPDHHDLVLAITSHLPHLIAYTIVGTADELAQVTSSEVIKFSAGGFRDFTRIAASDPTMWRDVFLANKEAVLEMLGTFNEDLSKLTRAIRRNDGEALFEHFTRTRAIRRGIVEIGQDSAAPDFGRPHANLAKKAELAAWRRLLSRHCERAKQSSLSSRGKMDCRVASLLAMTLIALRYDFAFSLRDAARSFAFRLPSRNQRAQGRPGARRTRGLVCNRGKKARTSIQVGGGIRPSLRNGFTAYTCSSW